LVDKREEALRDKPIAQDPRVNRWIEAMNRVEKQYELEKQSAWLDYLTAMRHAWINYEASMKAVHEKGLNND
jgi:hypothetical protein